MASPERGQVDVVINLFAPKNFPEAARVLQSDGVLACAYPGPDHFAELRREFGLMGIAEGKTDEYRSAAEGDVPRGRRRSVSARRSSSTAPARRTRC